MLGVEETIGVEVDPGTVVLICGGARASSLFKIEGRRVHDHSSTDKHVSTVNAIIMSSECSTIDC